MSYESLERELARRQSKRQSRRSKGDKKSKRKYSPYRRGGRKGSKARTRLAEGEDKLGKALAAARERAAKYAKPRLNITKLPDRDQRSLKDFDAESFLSASNWSEYAPTERIIRRLKDSGVWELGDAMDPSAEQWDVIKWWATVKIKDGTLVRATEEELGDLTLINIVLLDGQYEAGYGRVTVSYSDVDNAYWEDSYQEEMAQLGKELTIIFKNNGMFQSGDDLEYGDMGEFYNVHWGDLVSHSCADNAELDSYEDGIIVMECNSCGRTATFREETPYEGPRNAETFGAESDSYEWEWDRTDNAPTELIKKRLKEAGFKLVREVGRYKDMIVEHYEPKLVAKNGNLLDVALSQNEEFDGFSRLTFYDDNDENATGKAPPMDWDILYEKGLLKGEDSVENPQLDYYQVYWCGLYDEWKNGHNCADNAKFDIYEDNFIVMECNSCGRTATFEQKTPYEGPRNAETFDAEEKCPMPNHEGKKCGKGLYSSRLSPRPSIGRTTRGMMICGDCAGLESYAKGLGEWVDRYPNRRHDAETFNAESKDEAIVVEGYRPKRVETYMGTVALFYVGEMAERRYGPMSVTYQERTLLLPPIPNSIVNPTGIMVEDVDEIMQHYTGAPWTGEYVLFSEDTGHLVDSGRTRLYANFESEEFRAEPAMYVKCFECEKPGYSDEMSKIAFGHLCARCARPGINWDAYSAESGLNNTHRDILTYLSPFNPELVHRKYGIPAGLTQQKIGNAIGTVRTNATKHLQDLIELGLVTQIMRRPDGERRIVKVYLPTYEGRKIAESFRAEDLNGNGVIDAWETHAHENTLTGLAHEETHFSETFRANLRKTNLKPSQIREKAQEAFEGVTGWMWLSELTGKINSTLSARQRIAPGVVSRAIGSSTGGRDGFYITLNKRIFYYGDKDRGEFIKGVI